MIDDGWASCSSASESAAAKDCSPVSDEGISNDTDLEDFCDCVDAFSCSPVNTFGELSSLISLFTRCFISSCWWSSSIFALRRSRSMSDCGREDINSPRSLSISAGDMAASLLLFSSSIDLFSFCA